MADGAGTTRPAATAPELPDPPAAQPPGPVRRGPALSGGATPRWLMGLLVGVIGLGLVALGGGVAVLTGIGTNRTPGDTSVDAGFSRDMIVHHLQATEMAQIARDNSTDPAVRLIAYDIETQQLGQVGQMRGWLDAWGLTGQSSEPPMAWMAGGHEHGGLMPGMATEAELAKLRSLSGKALDLYFLQLMIRHHQGALPMARYAGEHATVDYVRLLAGKMVSLQSAEIVNLETMLRTRGGQPLPPPE